jgi:hypothetical protein
MRIPLSFAVLFTSLSVFAQVEDPVITIDPKAEAGYRDSLARHESSGAIWHYTPHRCQNRHGRFGWVDKYHKIVIPFDYQELPDPISHFNPAKKEGKYGAIDAKGKVIIPFKYSSLSPYYPQRIVVCREGPEKVSVFDFEGRVILPEEKRYNIWLFNDSIAGRAGLQQKRSQNLRPPGQASQILALFPYLAVSFRTHPGVPGYPDGSWLCYHAGPARSRWQGADPFELLQHGMGKGRLGPGG